MTTAEANEAREAMHAYIARLERDRAELIEAVRDLMSNSMLDEEAVGFNAMAEEILNERDFSRVQQYARIILKNAVEGKAKPEIKSRFALLGLI